MKKFIFLLISIFIVGNATTQTTETLITSDYIETYDWVGGWWFNNPTTGYFSDISSSPSFSAVIYGSGNNTYEQDWYALPTVTVDPSKDHVFKMRLAAQTISSPSSTTAGLDGGDYITVQLSQDGGSYVSELRVSGFSNATWGYSSTAVASKVANGSLTTFRPSSGGDRTSLGDGYSYIELLIPAGPTTIAIDIQARASRSGEDWWMDDFELFEVSTLLPVELLYFDAFPSNNQYAQLEWATATEINNDGFEVLRSTDGIDFEYIAWISGNGNQTSTHKYSYEDYSIETGITYYYRLKQIDYDGQYEYFNIESVKLSGPLDKEYSEILSVKYYSYLGKKFDVKPNLKSYIKCTSYSEGIVCEKIHLK